MNSRISGFLSIVASAVFLVSLWCVMPTEAFARSSHVDRDNWTMDRYLAKAEEAREDAKLQAAADLLWEGIKAHADRKDDVLTAVRHLCVVYHKLGKPHDIDELLTWLSSPDRGWELTPKDYRKLADAEWRYGDRQIAASYYEQALEAFRADPRPTYRKSVIRSVSRLLDVAERLGRSDRIALLLEDARDALQWQADIRDIERVARLHLEWGQTTLGERLLWQAATQYQVDPNTATRHAALRAFGRLADMYRARGDGAEIDRVLALFNEVFPRSYTMELTEREKVSEILWALGRHRDATSEDREIVEGYLNAPEPADRKAAIRALERLSERGASDVAELRTSLQEVSGRQLDGRDRYKLASLGRSDAQMAQNMREIISDLMEAESEEIPTLISALSTVLRHESARLGSTATPKLARWAADQFPDARFSLQDQYRLGLLFLRHGLGTRGEQILEIVADAGRSTVSAKALFVLAKNAHHRGDFIRARHRYRQYIERFGDDTFFALKAYSRLVEIYAQTGRTEQAKDTLERLEAIASGASDWEAQLNTARTLHHYGKTELAAATFELGYRAALRASEAATTPLDRLQPTIEIARYALDLNRSSQARTHAEVAIEQIQDVDRGALNPDDRRLMDHFEAVGRVIQIKASTALDAHTATIEAADAFLRRFPTHDDAPLVRRLKDESLEAQRSSAFGRDSHHAEAQIHQLQTEKR